MSKLVLGLHNDEVEFAIVAVAEKLAKAESENDRVAMRKAKKTLKSLLDYTDPRTKKALKFVDNNPRERSKTA